MATQTPQTSERVLQRNTTESTFVPLVDVYESEAAWLLVADLPGVAPDALKVEIEGTELRIEGRAPHGDDDGPAVYRRSFEVDASIDPDGVTAQLQDGVLRLEMKKRQALVPRRITVTSA